jgi:hypothetical protein
MPRKMGMEFRLFAVRT